MLRRSRVITGRHGRHGDVEIAPGRGRAAHRLRDHERERLRALRPAPLAGQPMPDGAEDRVAKAMGQVDRHEASGGYADQVNAALARYRQP